MRVIIKGNWAPYVGTDYCEALGVYDNLEQARQDAEDVAWERWEDCDNEDEETGEYVGEGPDFYVEEYIPGEDGHDMERAGGGSFEDDFAGMEN
jgi:hypothetical protein